MLLWITVAKDYHFSIFYFFNFVCLLLFFKFFITWDFDFTRLRAANKFNDFSGSLLKWCQARSGTPTTSLLLAHY